MSVIMLSILLTILVIVIMVQILMISMTIVVTAITSPHTEARGDHHLSAYVRFHSIGGYDNVLFLSRSMIMFRFMITINELR